jgi:hypothetical protein
MTVADRIIPGHHDISFESGQIRHPGFAALSRRLAGEGGLDHICAPTRIEHPVTALVEGPVRRFQRAEAGILPSSAPNLADALRIDAAFWIEHGDTLERRFNSWASAICRQQDDEDDDDYFDLPVCQDAQGKIRISRGPVSVSRIGQPGDRSEVSRTVTMTMSDAMRFTPRPIASKCARARPSASCWRAPRIDLEIHPHRDGNLCLPADWAHGGRYERRGCSSVSSSLRRPLEDQWGRTLG